MLNRTAIMVEDKFKGIEVLLSNGSLKTTTTSTDKEGAEDEIEVDYSGEDVQVIFNVHYLTEVLANMSGDKVKVDLKDSGVSALITDTSNPGFRYVVMPMKM